MRIAGKWKYDFSLRGQIHFYQNEKGEVGAEICLLDGTILVEKKIKHFGLLDSIRSLKSKESRKKVNHFSVK